MNHPIVQVRKADPHTGFRAVTRGADILGRTHKIEGADAPEGSWWYFRAAPGSGSKSRTYWTLADLRADLGGVACA